MCHSLKKSEDTVELTVVSALFKKEAKYFIGVRMVGHAGKVKTESYLRSQRGQSSRMARSPLPYLHASFQETLT